MPRFLSLTYDFYRCTLVSHAEPEQVGAADAHGSRNRYSRRSLAPGTSHGPRGSRSFGERLRLQHDFEANAVDDAERPPAADRALWLARIRIRGDPGPYAKTHRGRPSKTRLRGFGEATDPGGAGRRPRIRGGSGGYPPDDRHAGKKEEGDKMNGIQL